MRYTNRHFTYLLTYISYLGGSLFDITDPSLKILMRVLSFWSAVMSPTQRSRRYCHRQNFLSEIAGPIFIEKGQNVKVDRYQSTVFDFSDKLVFQTSSKSVCRVVAATPPKILFLYQAMALSFHLV